MPIQRFRSFEEAQEALWIPSGAPDLAQRLRSFYTFAARLFPPIPFPAGVRKFRSIEEANLDRDRWEQVLVQRLRGERSRPDGPSGVDPPG